MRSAPASDDDVVFDDFEIALEVNDRKTELSQCDIFGQYLVNETEAEFSFV